MEMGDRIVGRENGRPRVLVDISHPAHVHFFRNIISELESRGATVLVSARRKEVSLDLLREFGIPFQEIGDHAKGTAKKAYSAMKRTAALLGAGRPFRPDVTLGLHNPYAAIVGSLLGSRTILFIDSEPVRHDHWLTYPFADYIVTPRKFRLDLGPHQVRFDGYKELAYLHPNHFSPNESVLAEAGLSKGERFIVLRFVGWKAEHDRRQFGFSEADMLVLAKELACRARVLITSERALPPKLAGLRVRLRASRLHHLLSFADLLVTDSQTTCTEAAVLGVPVVRSNSLVGTMSNFDELENDYGLIFSFLNPTDAISKALELIDTPGLKATWRSRREKLLAEKVDTTEFMLGFIEKAWRSRNLGG